MRRASREDLSLEQLVEPLVQAFVVAIEARIAAQARALVVDWLERTDAISPKAASIGRNARTVSPTPAGTEARFPAQPARSVPAQLRLSSLEAVVPGTKPRAPKPPRIVRTTARTARTARPPRIQAPAPDPKDAERTAELTRLRSILRPTRDEPFAAEATATAPIARGPHSIEPPDGMKSLEEEIRDGIVFFSDLPPARCAAHIATWAGRARFLQECQPDGRTRIAAQLLLEKLRGLARAMDAGFIEALDPSWTSSDWDRYIKTKATAAESAPLAPASVASERPAAGDDYGDVWR